MSADRPGHVRRYRLEWRDPAEVDEAPSMGRWRDCAGGAEVRALAAALMDAGRAYGGEFAVAALHADGRAAVRIVTRIDAIGLWDPGLDKLPTMVPCSSWAAADAKADAAVAMLETMRAASIRAVATGAVHEADAAALMEKARDLLDDDLP